MKERIYILTRTDIPFGQQINQSCKSGMRYLLEHKPDNWNNDSIINLGLGSEKSIKRWINKLESLGLKFSFNREPDLNNELTSIAILHYGDIFKGIPLLQGGN